MEHSRPVLSIEEEYQIFLRYYRVLAGELGLKLTDAELKAVADDKVNNKDDNYRLFEDTVETLKALRGLASSPTHGRPSFPCWSTLIFCNTFTVPRSATSLAR